MDKSIYTRLRSNEFVALLRVNVLWKYLFSDPFRWLSGKTSKLEGWSLYKMCQVLKLVEDLMNEIVANPSRLLDPLLDPYASIAAEVPAFVEWRKEQLEFKAYAEDGTEYFLHQVVLREARTPQMKGHIQAHELTLELAKEQAQKALDKMHDPRVALADKLESQASHASAHAHAPPPTCSPMHARHTHALVCNCPPHVMVSPPCCRMESTATMRTHIGARRSAMARTTPLRTSLRPPTTTCEPTATSAFSTSQVWCSSVVRTTTKGRCAS